MSEPASAGRRGLIAALAEGGDPADPPKAAAPLFRVRLTIGDEKGNVMDRFWPHFMPKGELIRGSDGTWMPASDAYTGALKKVVNPSMAAYPASRLAKLVASDQPVPAHPAPASSDRSQPQEASLAGERGSARWRPELPSTVNGAPSAPGAAFQFALALDG